MALKYAGPTLRADKAVVKAAMASTRDALQFASTELIRDPEFQEFLLGCFGEQGNLFSVVRSFFGGVLAQQGVLPEKIFAKDSQRLAEERALLCRWLLEGRAADHALRAVAANGNCKLQLRQSAAELRPLLNLVVEAYEALNAKMVFAAAARFSA